MTTQSAQDKLKALADRFPNMRIKEAVPGRTTVAIGPSKTGKPGAPEK
jgi:hypothetical protein